MTSIFTDGTIGGYKTMYTTCLEGGTVMEIAMVVLMIIEILQLPCCMGYDKSVQSHWEICYHAMQHGGEVTISMLSRNQCIISIVIQQ
mgnify:CR=1 FL=1